LRRSPTALKSRYNYNGLREWHQEAEAEDQYRT
jgi:hypothetical protein